MPAAKPKAKRTQRKPKAAVKPKPVAKAEVPTVNGLPLRRKTVWAIDTDSPQFLAARKRDAQALRQKPDDRDSLQFSEAVLAEKDVQKWWN